MFGLEGKVILVTGGDRGIGAAIVEVLNGLGAKVAYTYRSKPGPDAALALQADVAARIMFTGMAEGWFTGKKLGDYMANGKADYVNARRIINGTDRAGQISGYARVFEAALP